MVLLSLQALPALSVQLSHTLHISLHTLFIELFQGAYILIVYPQVEIKYSNSFHSHTMLTPWELNVDKHQLNIMTHF
jgi:hypothetical protein